MTPLRFAVFGKNGLAAARCHALAACDDTIIVKTFSREDIAHYSDDDWDAALDTETLDAVVFALEPAIAVSASISALKKGLHVFSELPGGQSVEDIVNLREAERDSGAILKFGCGLRHHGSVREAQAVIADGAFGKLLTARAIYGHAGAPSGHFANTSILKGHGIQMLDLLHLFCGPFESVKAMSSGQPNDEANVFALLRTADGAIAQLHSSSTSWRQTFRLELGFERGYVWLDGHLPGLEGYGPEMLIHATLSKSERGEPVANPDETIREFTQHSTAKEELTEFLDAIAGRAPLGHGNSHQAFDAINIAERICAACETWA
ncbi:Gfo/Idh/MocA family oxidoreductase [Henriciella sp. AS95]|uniref:Gfo/Idh/MocA family protein n=1 Tax=Henriciella sp. AS95 TaxID=3135782 RepID=UPI003182917D